MKIHKIVQYSLGVQVETRDLIYGFLDSHKLHMLPVLN
jgi:hypothetical protein